MSDVRRYSFDARDKNGEQAALVMTHDAEQGQFVFADAYKELDAKYKELLAVCKAIAKAAMKGEIVAADGDYIGSRGSRAIMSDLIGALEKAEGEV